MNYIIVIGHTILDLKKSVNDFLMCGYELQGGLVVYKDALSQNTYAQAMFRKG